MHVQRLTTALLFLLLASTAGLAQPPRNAAYLEIGGNGVIPTINYERRFTDRLAGRIGFTVFTGQSDDDTDITYAFPLMANFISHPQRNHHFEAGGGVLFVVGEAQDFGPGGDTDEQIANVAITGLAGYRYQKPGRGFLFRAGITPFYADGDFLPFAGISFGYGW